MGGRENFSGLEEEKEEARECKTEMTLRAPERCIVVEVFGWNGGNGLN